MDLKPYEDCHLCPRNCGVNRAAGKKGYCGETAVCRVSSASPHFGEEPSFSGTRGSGTIFFTGCSCRCFFCQNYQISREGMGTAISPASLLDAAQRLADRGVHNINFVTPDHFWPHVAYVCEGLRQRGVEIPMLLNTSGYVKEGMVPVYAEHIDIFMPDFKFASPSLAETVMNDRNYPAIALAALRKMVELKGFLHPWDPIGLEPAREGVFVRHLVLPGHVRNSLDALRLLHAEFGSHLPISVMSQFHPVDACFECGQMTRRVTASEFRKVVDLAEELGFEHAYVQSIPDNDDFLPDFREDEPFRGNRERET